MAKKNKNNVTAQKTPEVAGRAIGYSMTAEAYKGMLDEFKTPDAVLAYINQTYGLLGTVTEIVIEG